MTEYPGFFSTENFKLNVSGPVIETWQSHRQITRHLHESFGVLVGSKSSDASIYWLDEITTPLPDDTHTRFSFILRDKGHQEKVNHAYRQSANRLGYMGTWHTHPENYPVPSTIDLRDWRACSARNQDRKMFFIIVGIKQTKLFTFQNQQITSTTLIIGNDSNE